MTEHAPVRDLRNIGRTLEQQLAGALIDRHWNDLDDDHKRRLRAETAPPVEARGCGPVVRMVITWASGR